MVKFHSDSDRGNPLPPEVKVLFYAQESTYHDLCYTSCGALVGMRISSLGPP